MVNRLRPGKCFLCMLWYFLFTCCHTYYRGKTMDEIMKHIQDLVIYENFRDDDDPSKRL